MVGSASFLKDLEQIEVLAWAPAHSPALLARSLGHIYERAAQAEFSDYDVREIRKVAPELMYRLFDLRVALRERIAEFDLHGYMTPDVTRAMRNVFRVLRYVSDMLGEVATGNPRLLDGGAPRRGFTGTDYNTLVNYNFYRDSLDLPFQSGDVVLVRGRAHNSAAIARIGDTGSQFSHIGIVHIDEDGRHWMVESLIEDGAIINPLAKALDHGIARAVLYRHRDRDLAMRASQAIFDYVAGSRGRRTKRILYDFSMRLDENRKLFCSKLVRLAYALASEKNYVMPTYPTRIIMENRDFLDRIGVKAAQTFAPADIDMEAGFDLVAEWQDYRETANIRLQDFTMDKLFEWMEKYGYRFEETFSVKLVSWFGRFSARFSDDAKEMLSSLFPRVPINMPRKTVAAVAMLHETAQPIYRELQRLDHETVMRTGVPMHGLEVLEALERIRVREGRRIGYLVRD
jgi:hypothetical protein